VSSQWLAFPQLKEMNTLLLLGLLLARKPRNPTPHRLLLLTSPTPGANIDRNILGGTSLADELVKISSSVPCSTRMPRAATSESLLKLF
jgi:hypothetical protein